MMNVVMLLGRLTADPQLRQTQQGRSVASFSIAIDRNFTAQDGSRQTDFINCVAWRQSAEFVSKYFKKGDPIAVSGSIQTGQYQDKNGEKRTSTEVLVNQISFVPAPVGWRRDGQTAAPSAPQQGFAPAMGEPVYQQQAMPGAGQSHQARAGYAAGVPSYAQGGTDDFAPISDDGDLPF